MLRKELASCLPKNANESQVMTDHYVKVSSSCSTFIYLGRALTDVDFSSSCARPGAVVHGPRFGLYATGVHYGRECVCPTSLPDQSGTPGFQGEARQGSRGESQTPFGADASTTPIDVMPSLVRTS